MRSLLYPLLASLSLALSACGGGPALPTEATYGPNPQLGARQQGLLPVLKVAPAQGWPANAQPQAPAGFTVTRFAEGLNHPRWLYLLPNGDVLVAETNAPAAKPQGLKAMIEAKVMKTAGAGVPSPD
ncbi:MAG TPA: sorbosone dehydrogenase family protein, partial [Caulobacteraceae bacterium]|nr:sorbosone dehydrogenase family protein [Caulobacteraceae bacterium]